MNTVAISVLVVALLYLLWQSSMRTASTGIVVPSWVPWTPWSPTWGPWNWNGWRPHPHPVPVPGPGPVPGPHPIHPNGEVLGPHGGIQTGGNIHPPGPVWMGSYGGLQPAGGHTLHGFGTAGHQ